MDQELAETIAYQALAWVVAHEELRPVFLGATGASPEDLRAGQSDLDTLASVLGFVTMDDDWVREFCDSAGLAPDQPLRALHSLPGNEAVNWT